MYYRIKQVDVDSRMEYSTVVAISLQQQKTGLRLYPNPAINQINLSGNELNGQVQYRVFDNSGKIVDNGTETANNNLVVDISKLARGKYYLDIHAEGLNRQMQFIKN